jgi:aspartate kinase
MELIKVGGSVLRTRQGFESFLTIVNDTRKPVLVIVSAFAKATRSLSYVAAVAESGYKRKALALLQDIFDEHKKFTRLIIKDQSAIIELFNSIDGYYIELAQIIEGIAITKELSLRIKDIVLSYGEKLALLIISRYLDSNNMQHLTIDAGDIIVSDEYFGQAKPLERETAKNIEKFLLPALRSKRIVIMQGFVAKSKNGETTTMGIESSNLTAVLMAKLLHLKKITFRTDVCGIRDFDPRIVAGTKLVNRLNYADAFRFGKAGLKLIYPTMIDYAKDSDIELVYMAASCPSGEQTSIQSGRTYIEPVVIAAQGKSINRIKVSSEDEISKVMAIMRNMFDKKIISSSYLKLKDDELIFITNDGENYEKMFKGLDYYKDSNISIITLFNVPFDKLASLLIKRRNERKVFPALIKLIDFSEDYVAIGIKERYTKTVLTFLSRHLEALK